MPAEARASCRNGRETRPPTPSKPSLVRTPPPKPPPSPSARPLAWSPRPPRRGRRRRPRRRRRRRPTVALCSRVRAAPRAGAVGRAAVPPCRVCRAEGARPGQHSLRPALPGVRFQGYFSAHGRGTASPRSEGNLRERASARARPRHPRVSGREGGASDGRRRAWGAALSAGGASASDRQSGLRSLAPRLQHPCLRSCPVKKQKEPPKAGPNGISKQRSSSRLAAGCTDLASPPASNAGRGVASISQHVNQTGTSNLVKTHGPISGENPVKHPSPRSTGPTYDCWLELEVALVRGDDGAPARHLCAIRCCAVLGNSN